MPPSLNKRRGFTLVEIMIALLVVSLGMAAAIQASGLATDTQVRLRDKVLAHWVAQNHFTELRLSGEFPNTGNQSGEVEMGGRDWYWEQITSRTEVDDVLRVDIHVRANDDGDQQPISSLSVFLARQAS